MYSKRSSKPIIKCNANDHPFKHSIKETPFERHYGRKPRTEITSYLNKPTDINEIVSARPEPLQVYSFNNGDGEHDQLIMKAPRRLKYDVSNKFPYQFLEKKKQNKNKFESNYETKPQTAIAGKKHNNHGYE